MPQSVKSGFGFSFLLASAILAPVAALKVVPLVDARWIAAWSGDLAGLVALVGFVFVICLWWVWQSGIRPALTWLIAYSFVVGAVQALVVANVLRLDLRMGWDLPIFLFPFWVGAVVVYFVSLLTRPYEPKGAAETD